MRSRTFRAALASMTLAGVVLGVAPPARAAVGVGAGPSVSQDRPTNAEGKPQTPPSEPTAAPSPRPRAPATPQQGARAATSHGSRFVTAVAPRSASVGDPRADEGRSTIALALEVGKDGNGPFTPEDGPGADADAANGIVRTFDAVTYRVTMNSNGAASTNERFTLTASGGTKWAGVPAPCTGPGSAISGQELACNLGTVAQGQARVVPAVLDVSGDLRDGDTIAVHASGTADNADGGDVSATSDEVTVSAAGRYNLAKNVTGSALTTDVVGPDGRTAGFTLRYPITVDWQPVVPGQGLLGFERSGGELHFTDDVSSILGDLPSSAVLWNGGHPVCGPNENTAWRFSAIPGGTGGGANGVTDSGTFRCTQSAPGRDVDVTISGVVTDPGHLPSKNLVGGPIAGGAKPYFVSGFISFWLPYPPGNTSVESVNRFTPLQTASAGGAPNFPGGTEPTGDNAAARTIVELAGGRASKTLYRAGTEDEPVREGSAKRGDPWVTGGTQLRSTVEAWNSGLSSFDGVILCDTFDRSTQRLSRVGEDQDAAWTTRLQDAKVQYAAYTMTSAGAGQRATCGDEDAAWFDRPEDVPGGIGAVGAVRAAGNIAGGATAALHSSMTTRSAPDGTRAYDFGHVWFGDRRPEWVHDGEDPVLGAGGLADSVLITENLARVTKKIVDPGHDASDTPDGTSFVVAGATVDYALYPTLTNGSAAGRGTTVTVRDTLPLHATYVVGSASEQPVRDTVEDADGAQHERLTWTLRDVEPNEVLDPITYTAEVSKRAPAGPITNTAEISSPTDRSDLQYRNARRAVQVVSAGGVGVEKNAVRPVVVAGDRLEWDLGYTNTDAAPIDGLDVIDVLPHRGDDRGSSFHGSVALAGPVDVHSDEAETVVYTDTAPADVDLDGDATSNQQGGLTRWCGASTFGTDGCPSSYADVTAFRIQRGASVGVGETVMHRVALVTEGACDDDSYTNQFGLRASNLALPVESNPATIRVVAGAVGDHVWTDTNGDGLQDDGEPGIPDVAVSLAGTDDLGQSVERRTETDDDGDYGFGDLRPGTYVVTFSAPDGRSFTKPLVGSDGAIDSDAGDGGRTDPIDLRRETAADGSLVGVDRLTSVDAGVRPADDPGVPVDPGAPVGPGTPVDPGAPTGPGAPGGPDQSGSGAVGAGTSGAASGDPGDRTHDALASSGSDALAFTGASGVGSTIAVTVVLLSIGVGLLIASRRRRVRRAD